MNPMISDTDILHMSLILTQRGLRIAFAESCSGGLASEMVTSVPGASEYFLGSAVTYSNEAKERILGVSHSVIEEHGAVSEECAKEMAAGALKAYDSDIAGSITGIAGPGGTTFDKPVGLVYTCATDGVVTVTSVNRFYGDRDEVRRQSVDAMIRDIMKVLEG